MSWLEAAAALVSALSVWLTGRRAPVCWGITIIASLLYGVVFWQARLYADMALQTIFAGLAFYGWWGWRQGVRATGGVQVVPLTRRTLWGGVVLAALGGIALGAVLRTTTDDPLPMLDALLSAYSILGQIWLAQRHKASWWLWIVVDTIYTGLFLERALYLTAALYATFVLLAVYGLFAWRQSARTKQQDGQV